MRTRKSGTLLACLLLASAGAHAQQDLAINGATVSLPGGLFDPNTANNSATDSDTIVKIADLSVTKSNPPGNLQAGSTTTYTIVASNAGPSAANGAVIRDDWTLQPGLDCSAGPATCVASGAATTACPAAASVTPAALLAGLAVPTLPNGGTVTLTLQCVVLAPVAN